MKKTIIRLVNLPTINDDCFLSVAELKSLPFSIKRMYTIYKPVSKLSRGYHAHKNTQQILFCLHGSATIVLDDGTQREKILLSEPSTGVILDKMIWHEMHDLNSDTVLLVLASKKYDANDYIRKYPDFIKKIRTPA